MPFTRDDPNINRSGRPPKADSLSHILWEYMAEVEKGKDRKSTLIQKIYSQAVKGDRYSQRLIFEYIDGKPTQEIRQEIDMPPDSITINLVPIGLTKKHKDVNQNERENIKR